MPFELDLEDGRSTDVSSPESLNSRDVEGRPRSQRDWLLTARVP